LAAPFSEDEDGQQEATIEGQPPVTLEVLRISPPRRLHTRMNGRQSPRSSRT